jgi:hypothetical protein
LPVIAVDQAATLHRKSRFGKRQASVMSKTATSAGLWIILGEVLE